MLPWLPDDESKHNYLRYDGYIWGVDDDYENSQFTESELERIKHDNPRLAPAIDAMKEPAENMITSVTSHQIVSDLANTIKKSDNLTRKINRYISFLGEDVLACGIISVYKNVEHATFRDFQSIFDYYLKLKELGLE